MKKFVLAFFTVLFLAFGISYAQEAASDGFQEKLKSLGERVDRVEAMKQEKDPAWEKEVMEAYADLTRLLREKPTSAETYYLLARCFDLNERPRKAKKAVEKAMYFDPAFINAYLFYGDLNVRSIKRNLRDVKAEDYDTEFYTQKRHALKAYDRALAVQGIDKDTQGLIYLKIGDLHDIFPRDKKEAVSFWQKAVDAAPESQAGKKAQERLARAK